ncbi:PilT/PilU family type 4a pilus ATPase [Candidatus Sumerlaeota bacterium]|nr:PilT/PilU family type 4a pilus ATPase [Candidatus Sumerlaeota bacterium]
MLDLDSLLTEMIEHRASDMFIKAGVPPAFRIDGSITPTRHSDATIEDTMEQAQRIMTERQWQIFQDQLEMDLSYAVRGLGRFRVNIFLQRGSVSMAFRHVPSANLSFEELNLPAVVRKLAEEHRGLVLVTGTTGSGKSTTLAAMINHINRNRCCHIVTIEDPIEFLHPDAKSIITQREIGFDTLSFSAALKHVLRQSPDVILIGEMRDVETIQTAVNAAETGHLVFSTLHTIDAVQTVERIINYFPAHLHAQIRMELGLCLQGVVSMRLLPHACGRGRVPAVEIMIGTPLIRKLLHEGKTLELPQYIEQGSHVGMQTFNQSLLRLYNAGLVRMEDALAYATSPDEFRLMAEGIATGVRAREFDNIYRM